MSLDPVDLTAKLIACPSVTPREAGTLTLLTEWLKPLGFECHHFVRGETPDGPVENLIAVRKAAQPGPHFAFAGHVDVVPPGEGWDSDPFHPVITDTEIIGRGATDMKGAIGAFVAALEGIEQDKGTLSLLITGDEEGPAVYGTRAIIDELETQSLIPDMCLIGEPSSVDRLGDTIKHGRRGSVNMWLETPGHQGHVAYPHLADNPIPKLARLAFELDALVLDHGDPPFQASNLELTLIESDDGSTGIIPGQARARLNVRFNRHHSGEALVKKVEELAAIHAPGTKVEAKISGEAFLTRDHHIIDLVSDAVNEETGLTPERSTGGGTSDGRFLHRLCPVIEFGLPNATMHKVGERAALSDIRELTAIYRNVLKRVFA
ncbi:succinyl-diaminopimelate desuccinylase [Sphingomicrobium sediminis]|uniref:Succinyl-diaminopimelate desuccinylase n=1 Tax=Sphingomicrobium sediminis TaxID=2950949 RepID=A0A9X2J4C2_9SPHN|nr:succinyl-diaminopimelate desuccinylase [Sphingomicrobium sediminis]MCM8557067.1 succinyl-diaminopimelate desuccinylase [Sphingomicrobium sediminis]